MMINASIKITDIQYEDTLRNIFPYILEPKSEKESLVFRLLQKMGDDALTFILGFTEKFSVPEKNRLAAVIVNRYSKKLVKSVNKHLHSSTFGKAVQIQGLQILCEGDSLVLLIQDIAVDSMKVLKENEGYDSAVHGGYKRFGGVGAALMGKALSGGVEAITYGFLKRKEVQDKLVESIQNIAVKKGIILELADFELSKVQEGEQAAHTEDPDLTEELTEKLLDAAAEYLKEMIQASEQESNP